MLPSLETYGTNLDFRFFLQNPVIFRTKSAITFLLDRSLKIPLTRFRHTNALINNIRISIKHNLSLERIGNYEFFIPKSNSKVSQLFLVALVKINPACS